MKNRVLFNRLLLKRHICRAVPSWDYTIAQFAINVTLRWIFQIISMLNSWTKSYSCKRHLVANYLLRCQTNSCYSNLICRNSFWFLVSVIVIYRGPDHGSWIKNKEKDRPISRVKDKLNAQLEKETSENSRLRFNYNYSEGLSATIVSIGFIFLKSTRKERSLNCLDFQNYPIWKFAYKCFSRGVIQYCLDFFLNQNK